MARIITIARFVVPPIMFFAAAGCGSVGTECSASCPPGYECQGGVCVAVDGGDADGLGEADVDDVDDVAADADADADGAGGDADADDEVDADVAADADADADADACTPDFCNSRECGENPCGGTCGPGCGGSETCTAHGHCVPTLGLWVEIPAGTFQMGSPFSEVGRDRYETQHTVTLTRGFVMEVTEVTQAEFLAVIGTNPSTYPCDNCPVETVTTGQMCQYCNALSEGAGRPQCYMFDTLNCWMDTAVYPTPYDCPGYRLPTEAEWEYAARAGTTTATYNGDLDAEHLACEAPNPVLDPIAWFCGNTTARHQVSLKLPNAWGLYDMLGNVWERVGDEMFSPADPVRADYPPDPVVDPFTATAEDRVCRGGGLGNATSVRAAKRSNCTDIAAANNGFRPVRTLP